MAYHHHAAASGSRTISFQGKTRIPEQNKDFECSVCQARFSFRTNLNRHKRNIHKNETRRERTACLYSGCTAKFYHQTKLLSHLESAHGRTTEKSELTFVNMDEFLSWKLQEEARSFVCFTKPRGNIEHQSATHQHFICQRDGSSRRHTPASHPGAKTSRRRKKGVVKTDLSCPARMLVRECKRSMRVSVSYYKSHSHPVSPQDTLHHPIPAPVRKEIKSRLAAGASLDQVQKEILNAGANPYLSALEEQDPRLKNINRAQLGAMKRRLKQREISDMQAQLGSVVVQEVLQMVNNAVDCSARGRDEMEVTPATESSNLHAELLFSEPVSAPLLGGVESRDYAHRLQAILNEILSLLENENVRKAMLPGIMGNFVKLLASCRQEARSADRLLR